VRRLELPVQEAAPDSRLTEFVEALASALVADYFKSLPPAEPNPKEAAQ
jgi:hypothetical protein